MTKEDLPTSTSTISLSYKLNFVQTDEKVTSTEQSSSSACTSFEKKDTYSVGDVIALCNTSTNKSEDFYVIKDNGTTVTALAKYNLLVGDIVTYNWDSGESSSVPISKDKIGYGLQDNSTKIEFDLETGMPKTNIVVGYINFAVADESKKDGSDYYGYWSDTSGILLSKYGNSYPTYVFDSNSLLYEPLQNYKNYLKNTLSKSSVTTNLMTYENLTDLGCDGTSKNNVYTCKSAPIWVYNTSYWTASASSGKYIWYVQGDGVFFDYGIFYDYDGLGLRPVITIKKSEL